MNTISISLTQDPFEQYIHPSLSVAQRGYVCRSSLYKMFNYIL